MKRFVKRSQVALALVLCLACTSCADADLGKVGKALTITATAVGELQTIVLEANTQQLISDESTREILQLSIKVSQAGKEAVVITKAISKFTEPSKLQLLQVLTPVINSVNTLLDQGTLNIKNEATRTKVRGVLLSIQTSLSAVQLILVGGK